jgi:hypothetical protein
MRPNDYGPLYICIIRSLNGIGPFFARILSSILIKS